MAQHSLITQLLSDLRSAPTGTRATVIDIGSNDGKWSAAWQVAQSRAAHRQQGIDLVMVEPNPSFRERLSLQAARQNATFIAAAASKRDGTAIFAVGDHSKEGRLGPADTDRATSYSVRTVDAAAMLRAHLPPTGGLSLVKIDLEGHEFEVLPWLLMQKGALCRARYLLVEWHINEVEPGRRLSALGLRLTFNELLRNGCSVPPLVVHHDDYMPNNQALAVPGLPRVAMEHASWAGTAKGGINIWRATTAFENSDYRKLFGQHRRAPTSCGAAPLCMGSCTYEKLACDVNATGAWYASMMAHKVPVASANLLTRSGDQAQHRQPLTNCECRVYSERPQAPASDVIELAKQREMTQACLSGSFASADTTRWGPICRLLLAHTGGGNARPNEAKRTGMGGSPTSRHPSRRPWSVRDV